MQYFSVTFVFYDGKVYFLACVDIVIYRLFFVIKCQMVKFIDVFKIMIMFFCFLGRIWNFLY